MHAPAAALVSLLVAAPALAAPALADPGTPTGSSYAPPYVDRTEWAYWGGPSSGLSSLRVYPTWAGRAASRQSGTGSAVDEAWAEVLARSPNADTPGMRAQFVCHWQFAEIAQPGKTSWNLEPWRPVVDDNEMIASHCNPGAAEEPF